MDKNKINLYAIEKMLGYQLDIVENNNDISSLIKCVSKIENGNYNIHIHSCYTESGQAKIYECNITRNQERLYSHKAFGLEVAIVECVAQLAKDLLIKNQM